MKHPASAVAIFLLLALILAGCSLRSYRRNLPTDLKDWYYEHRILMEGRVPTWINGRSGRAVSEDRHFLTLPTREMQHEYKKVFWEMRYPGLKLLWAERRMECERLFRGGVRSDRGHVYMRFGYPDSIFTDKDITGTYRGGVTAINGSSVLVWDYFFGSRLVRYVFRYRTGDWHTAITSTVGMSEQTRHHKWFIKVWSPTIEGWEIWASILYHLVEGE